MIDVLEYADLIVKLNKWLEAYAKGNSIVSDKVYDEEYKKLKQFERANPSLIEKDSPTQGVNDGHSDGFQKVTHEVPKSYGM